MNTKNVLYGMAWFVNRMSVATSQYELLPKEFESIKEGFYKYFKNNPEAINLNNITKKDAFALGFAPWNSETDPKDNYYVPNLYLIPHWFIPLIPEGYELTTISGKKIRWDSKTADTETRFGVLAYGIIINE